jgi:NADH dehydrogenase (ubiquinone) Fe-S protein 8
MAFVRHPSLALGLSTRLLLSRATGTPSITLLSLRHFSSTPRTLQAQPAHTSGNDSIKSPRLETGLYAVRDEPGKYVNPYEGGQSALEKAAHLFFFTEIVRGAFPLLPMLFPPYLNGHYPRHVASLGTVFPSPIYNHVSFREGSSLPSLPWRARASSLSER